MTDFMAVVSPALAEAAGPPAIGTRLRIDRYVSTQAGLAPLARGGRLYLMTLRPPPEQLWLVAVLEQPKFDGTQWVAAASELPITDLTHLRSKLRFVDNAGWNKWCEACQQTHWYGEQVRRLTPDDVALIDAAAGIPARPVDDAVPSAPGPGFHRGELLDIILEHPASDEARRIYADQLLAENDVRGEFILIDIALAGPLSIRKREQLAARRAHLLAGHGPIWWPYDLARRETQRGFLRAVHGSWTQIAAIADELFAREPVTELGVRGLDVSGLTALLHAGWLHRIDRLVLRKLPGDVFATLASAPQLAQLRALDVASNELGAGACSGIASALPHVENLVLTGNPLGDAGLAALRAWRQLANVRTLYLSSCELGEAGLAALLDGPRLDKLAMLALSYNRLGDAGAAVLASRAAQLPALAHLELKGSAISAAGVAALARAFPALRRLDVRRNRLDRGVGDARIVV